MDQPVSRTFPDGDLADAVELGAVSDRSVRVWLRQPGGLQEPVRLEVEGRTPVTAFPTLTAETDWTGAVELALDDPAPDQPFTVSIGEHQRRARFSPSPGSHGDFTFAFGSCHLPFARADEESPVTKTQTAAIYPAIQTELANADARFLLLLGDQLYADALPGISVRDDLPGDEDHPPSLEVAIDAYRRITRGFFAETGFRAVRESLPTLSIWDDHDIFNDWGSQLQESPLEKRLFAAADRVFREYQQPRNPITTSLSRGDAPPYPFFARYGTIGLLTLDIRGTRSFEDGRLLGRRQWELIHDFFASETVREIQTLFVVSSVPIAHVSRWFVELFQRLPWQKADSVRDRWCSRSFIASRDELLRDLFTWQGAQPARQAIILSGDVHSASAFTIRDRTGPGVIQQFTSSAFTSLLVGQERRLNWLSTRAPNIFEPSFAFGRHFLNPNNNVGLVRLTARPVGGHTVTFSVRAWHPDRRRLVDGGQVTVAPEARP